MQKNPKITKKASKKADKAKKTSKMDANVKSLIIRVCILVGILSLLGVLFKAYLGHTAFFLDNFRISAEYVKLSLATKEIEIINAVIFGIVCFILLIYQKLKNIKPLKFEKNQVYAIIASLTLIVAYYWYKYLIHHNVEFFIQNVLLWDVVKIIIFFSFAITILMSTFGWNYLKYLYNKFSKELHISVGLTVCFFFLTWILQNLWLSFTSIIGKIMFWFFGLFYENISYIPFLSSPTMLEGGGPMLYLNGFSAIIGRPCAGIDSLLLYIAVFALIIILDYKKMKKWPTAIFFVVGAIGMFFVNIIRLLLLFIIGSTIDARFALGLFHTNIGWILFMIYFVVYWVIIRRYIYEKNTKKK